MERDFEEILRWRIHTESIFFMRFVRSRFDEIFFLSLKFLIYLYV